MQCPRCGTSVEPSATRCPACRRWLPAPGRDAAPPRWVLWSIGVVAVCLVLAGLVTAGVMVFQRAKPGPPIVTEVPRPSTHNKHHPADGNTSQQPKDGIPPTDNPDPTKPTRNEKVHPLLEPDPGTEVKGVIKELDIFGAIRARDDAKVLKILKIHPEMSVSRNYKGATPLHLAVALGDETMVRALLASGADVNAKCDQQMLAGQTPLHIAAGRNNTTIMRLLLDKGARVNVKDAMGATPLHESASHGSKDAAALLLKSGAAVEARQNDGQTALFWTAVGGNPAVTRLLLDNGADINARDFSELTPLAFAEALGSKEIAGIIRKRGGKE